jgi:hypothetical protein
MSSYPSSIKSFTTKVDNVDDVMAADVNDLQAEVVAIETALGVNMALAQGVKGWLAVDCTGTMTILDSFNVSGLTDEGAGDITITWDVDFGSANYAIVGNTQYTSASGVALVDITSIAAGSCRVKTKYIANSTPVDCDYVSIIAIGDR